MTNTPHRRSTEGASTGRASTDRASTPSSNPRSFQWLPGQRGTFARRVVWSLVGVGLIALTAAVWAQPSGSSAETPATSSEGTRSIRLGLANLDAAEEIRAGLAAYDTGQALRGEEGNPEAARRQFEESAAHFRNAIDTGVINGKLEFNLGNALVQADDLGGAILHYRRAERLMPGDPWLKDNLERARTRCLTVIKPTGRQTFVHSLFFWHYDTTIASRLRLALITYLLVWGLLTVRAFVPRRGLIVAAALGAVIALVSSASAAVTLRTEQRQPPGVIMAMDVMVRKGPGTAYERLFAQPLQPGVEFTRLEARGQWWHIELPDANDGWIHEKQAALIPYAADGDR
jgi:hypothetical protein